MSTIATLSTSDTPADTLITKFNDNFSNLNTDKLEASDIAGKQNTLVSGTNIKTLNSNSLLGSGDLSIPTLTDGDKGDLTLTSSGTVWTIDNDVVTNAKMANVASATFKGRTTVGTWDPEDMTATQATALLDVATTSLKGLMSSTDKTKLDGLSNEWTQVYSWSYSSGGTLNTGTLTVYDEYKIEIIGTQTGSSSLSMRHNSDSTWIYSRNLHSTSWIWSRTTWNTELTLFTFAGWSGYRFVGRYYIDRVSGAMVWEWKVPFDGSNDSIYLRNWFSGLSVTSIQISSASNIAGSVKVYGRNY